MAGRPRDYTPQVTSVIERVIRQTKCLREARRVLAGQYDGPWGDNGPSIKKMREVHRSMNNPPKLNNLGGRPTTYTEEQRAEMARLAGLYGVTGSTGAMAILSADNRTMLSRKRNKKIFPHPVSVSQPTITEAAQTYEVAVGAA